MLLNRPLSKSEKICKKCGTHFIAEPFTTTYSTKNGQLITLCDKCAKIELEAGRVTRVLY